MGFLNKAFRKVKKQIQPGNMIARDMGPGNMPRRGGGFLSRLRGRKPGMISDMRFRGEMPRGGGFGNLGEAIRRMQEQGQFGVPRGSRDPSTLESMQRTPQPIPERMPTDPSSYYNPTIFGQPIPQGADFSNMPDFSQIDMSQLDLSGIPQSISQMNLPQMPEGLPSIEEIQGNRRMPQMGMGEMQPRMMMAEGDEVINIIDALQEYGLTVPREVAEQLSRKSGLSLQSINEIINEGGRTISDMDRQQTGRTISDLDRGRTISDLDRGRTISDMDRQIGMMYGGEMKGYANGGEIENMLSGMDSGEQEAMGELEQMAPEMEMIDQLVMMVVQMIQQGAGEEQVISFLREQGLDDEDIGTVLQLVSEMAETEEMAAQNEIGTDLEQLG